MPWPWLCDTVGTINKWPPEANDLLRSCSLIQLADMYSLSGSILLKCCADLPLPSADLHNMSTPDVRMLIKLTGPTAVKVLQHSPTEEQKQVLAVMKVRTGTENHI
jgi:hypothetical protein